jgi:hypothetical protein
MEGIDVVSITDLILKADIRWKAEAVKRKEQQVELKAKMEASLAEESGLIKELKQAKKTVAKMESDYFEFEKKAEKEEKKRIEKEQLTAEKVKSGEISLREFQSKGITEKQKSSLVIAGILKRLKDSLNVIRSKRKEILQLELELAKLHKKIFQLSLYPGRVLSDALKDQKSFIDREMTALYSDMAQSDSSVKLCEHKLHLIEGGGLSAGHRWNRLSLEQARMVLFDPIIPWNLIQDFTEQLQQFQDPEGLINVILHLPGGRDPSIEVVPTAGRGPKKQVIQTGEKVVKKKHDRKFITTKNLNLGD